ncbi:MAG: NERD domain-containing protein [Rivularia sp. (in: Bacteria)]|nr:NERD domain-containing protein [Rivularia sp. MS3]
MIRYFLAAGVAIATLWLFIFYSTSSIGVLFLFAGFGGSYYLYRTGKYFDKRALDAQRGAKAETDVADILDVLELQKWRIEYNLRIKRWGDADIVLHSPKDNWYVIDVKSHGGTKISERGRLRRRYGKKIHDFREGDLLYKVKGQAKEVRLLKGIKWVTAMLCFTRGGVDISNNEVNGVYVVSLGNLVDTLLRLDK